MRIGRGIIAVLIGLSVATLPAANGFATNGKTMEASASETMPDCNHDHQSKLPNHQPHKTADDSGCMAACALSCFNFTAADFSGIVFSSPAGAALKLARMSSNVSSLMGSPPFRPPRS